MHVRKIRQHSAVVQARASAKQKEKGEQQATERKKGKENFCRQDKINAAEERKVEHREKPGFFNFRFWTLSLTLTKLSISL